MVKSEKEEYLVIPRINGLELNSVSGGKLIFVNHEYMGKEPDAKFIYHQINRLARKLGMNVNVASFICSDEENGLDRIKRSFYFNKVFATDIIGPIVMSQPVQVADHKGHSSNVYIFTGHVGMYKHPENGKLFFGKVESERDGTLRANCGALTHVMNRFLGKEKAVQLQEGDVDLIGLLEHSLAPIKQDFLKIYNSSTDEAEKISKGIEFLVRKNVEIQVQKLNELLKTKDEKHGDELKIVAGCITINRYKYPDTQILTNIFLIKGNRVLDLTKEAI